MEISEETIKELTKSNEKFLKTDRYEQEKQTIEFFSSLIDVDKVRIMQLVYNIDKETFIRLFSTHLTSHIMNLTRDTDKALELQANLSLNIIKNIKLIEKATQELKK